MDDLVQMAGQNMSVLPNTDSFAKEVLMFIS